MKYNEQSNIGWIVENGAGWNNHATATALNDLLAESPESLPTVPNGFAVLVGPVDRERPFGLRCALVRVLPRIIDENGWDDGCDESGGEPWGWATDFGIDGVKIYSCTTEQQSEDSSGYFIKKIADQLRNLTQSQPSL